MRSYVINLKRRPDRLLNFIRKYDQAKMNSNDILVYYGFDMFSPDIIHHEMYPKVGKFSQNLSNGAKGCFLSHLTLYKDFLKSGEEYGLIFEDDLCFCENFKPRLNDVLNEFKSLESDNNIYMLYIGGRFTPEYYMKSDNCVKKSEHIVQGNGCVDIHKKPDFDRTTHSYVITREGAMFLMEQFEKSSIIDKPIDHWLIEILPNDSIFHSYPLLCHSPLFSDSDVIK